MKHFPKFLAALVLLSALLGSAPLAQAEPAAAPAAQPAADGPNLLVNPGFESPYGKQCCHTEPAYLPNTPIDEVQVAAGWRAWWLDPRYPDFPPTCDGCTAWHRPEWREAAPYTNRIHGGANAQKYFTFYSVHKAGMYQQVSGLTPGQHLRFSIYMEAWSTAGNGLTSTIKDNDMGMKVGIDPYGGSDAFSSRIVWSTPFNSYDNWGLYTIEAVAQSSTVTVFTHSQPRWGLQHNDIYLDDASLVVTDGSSSPAPAATSVPSSSGSPVQNGLVANAGLDAFDSSGLALSWNRWWEEVPNPNTGSLDYAGKPDWVPESNAALTLGGQSQHIGTTWNPWHAGIYQVLSTSPGAQVHITASGRAFASNNNFPTPSDQADQPRMQIGADPTGGTDWRAGSVQWSGQGNTLDTWQNFSLDVTAGSNGKVTVFLAANFRGNSRLHQDVWWDSVSAQAGGSGAPAPTSAPASTSAPTATNAPAPTSAPAPAVTYVIQRGDTLYSIARKFNTTIAALLNLNNLSLRSIIYAGQTLRITSGSSAPAPTSAPSTSSGGTTVTTGSTQAGTYVIVRGDRLVYIARRFNVTLAALLAVNPGIDPARIFPGQTINIPASQASRTYVVQSGDTLRAIADRYGTTVAFLQAINNIYNVNTIFVGQTLLLP